MAAPKRKPAADQETPAEKPSFFDRFHAWWEGYDLDAMRANEADGDVLELSDEALDEPPDQALGADAAGSWPTETLEILQLIWGDGFTSPGGPDFVLELVRTLAPVPDSTILEIGSGLGGGARTIAEEFGARVLAWELDPDLAAEGASQAKANRMQDKAKIQHLDPANVEFPSNKCKGALVRDALHRIEDKEALLTAVVGAVNAQCDVVITDFMTAGADPSVDAWTVGEGGAFFLWDEDAARASLAGLGLDVRGIHDNTEAYLSMILRGLGELTRTLQERRPPRQQLIPTVNEVERWARLATALESGALRHLWITALKT